jgi:hypothetical protein
MGLDMYAYTASRAGQNREFYDHAEFDLTTLDYVNPKVTKPMEIAYWRKHPHLHGWMEQLWHSRRQPGLQHPDQVFNGIELELFREDIDRLEQDILVGILPETSGFFFGNDASEYYRSQDLEFVKKARAELFLGLRVFYNSSW